MTDHLPECPLNRECELPHAYINSYCMECERSCFCDELCACEQRMKEKYADVPAIWNDGFQHGLYAAREAVLKYASDTHQHVGMQACWPENGDRCDITAALRVAAQTIADLREEKP